MRKRRSDLPITPPYSADRGLCGQKCDAGRPCATCYNSQRECTYDEDSSASSTPEELVLSCPTPSKKSLVAFRGIRACTRPLPPQLVLQSPPHSFACSTIPLVPHPASLALMPKVPPERLEISEISTSDLHLNLYGSYPIAPNLGD